MSNFIFVNRETKEVKRDFDDYDRGTDDVYVRQRSITIHPLAMDWEWGSWGGWSCHTIIGNYYVVHENGWGAELDSHSKETDWEWTPENNYERYENTEDDIKRECEIHFVNTTKKQLMGFWYE